MIGKFLKAKHWQLFLLTFGIPMVFQFIIMGSLILNITSNPNPDLSMVFDNMKFVPVVMGVFIVVFLGWFWSVAMGLQKKVPENVKMKVKRFKILFFIPIVYIVLLTLLIGIAMNEILSTGEELMVSLFLIIIPIHLFSIFCMFHTLYFVAKTVKTVELQREVKFADFVGEFFMIWFYPIGIWIIQPKINKMIEE